MSTTLCQAVRVRSPRQVDTAGLWVEDVPASSSHPIAERRRAIELARPADQPHRVLLRYTDGESDLVIVTPRESLPVQSAPAPAWGLGGGPDVVHTHVLPVEDLGDERSWLAALAITLHRYDEETAAVVATEHGSFTVSADLRPTATDAPAAVGLLFLGNHVDGEYVPCLAPPFRLTVSVFDDDRGPRLRVDHSARDFAPEIAEQFTRHVCRVHQQMLHAPAADIELMDNAEIAEVAALGRSTAPPASSASTIHDAFRRVAAATPNATAVTDGSSILSYAELDELSGRVAHSLRARGVRAGDRVGVCLDRSASFVVTALGILKAGAAYVPMDTAHPKERLAHTAQDAELALVVTTSPAFEHAVVVPPGELLTSAAAPGDELPSGTPAYIIYTSGSTGRPKGVVVPHHNVIALVEATRDEYGLGREDAWTWFHSAAFDFSVWEIWACLLTGGRLVVVPHFVAREPDQFRDLLVSQRVTVLSQTPTAFAQLLSVDHADLAVRLVVFGGEPLDARMLLRWFDVHPETRCRMVNMFGITETTVHVTAQTVTRAGALTASRSVGRPLPGWHVHVLDPVGRLLPPGVAGEICVGGAGVALGYWNRTELTAERFVPNRFSSGTLYRSGDLGRLRPDGRIDHLGRIDNQVKIRGFRIELDEIRSVLLEDPRVSAAAVTVRRDTPDDAATARIDAYVVLTEQADTHDLRRRSAEILPEHMVPATVTALPSLPLTPNGKLDTSLLPAPAAPATRNSVVDSPKSGDAADRLRAIWSRVLGTAVGIDDDFFELGGNSLFAVRIGAAMRAEGLPAVRLREFYQSPTIRGVLGRLPHRSGG